MKTRFYISTAILLFAMQFVNGQHEHHQMQKDTTTKAEQPDKHQPGEAMHRMDSSQMPPMSHSYSLNLPMNRNGSGTGWLTDTSPMYGYMLHSKKWMYMIHGNIFIRYNNQDIGNTGTR